MLYRSQNLDLKYLKDMRASFDVSSLRLMPKTKIKENFKKYNPYTESLDASFQHLRKPKSHKTSIKTKENTITEMKAKNGDPPLISEKTEYTEKTENDEVEGDLEENMVEIE